MNRSGVHVAVLMAGFLWLGSVQAALFEDDEARKAILEVRQRVEASRLTTDSAIQRLVETQSEMVRKAAEENAQLRRALLDLQNQIESLRGELARSTGQREQTGRELSDLQRELKDQAQRQQELARGIEDRITQLEPVKLSVDGLSLIHISEPTRPY